MTDEQVFENVRDKDHTVLTCIQKGEDDVQKVKAATRLEKREVNYAFEKLEDLGLIDVHRPDGRIERVIDGQKRVFDAPKEATLTETAIKYLHTSNRQVEQYEDLSKEELIKKSHDLENRVTQLENGFEAFRQQVLQRLE
jgi:DNA-binding transcriptional ArsR family regulator